MKKYCENCGQEMPNKDLHLVVILDESGSMGSIWDSTISGINEFIQSQNIKDGKTWVTVTKFDTIFKRVYERADISQFRPFTKETYTPSGCTSLYDAIGDTLNRIRKGTEKIMVVIMTDGEENSSHQHSFQSIRNLIEAKKTQGWEFTFLGANMDSYAVGGAMGINTTVNWRPTNVGMRGMTQSMAAYTTSYRTTGNVMSSSDLQNLVDNNENEA